MNLLYLCLVCYGFIFGTYGQVIDLNTGEEVENFLESGYVTLDSSNTISVTTTNNFKYPVIVLSSIFSTSAYSDNIPVQARVQDFTSNNGQEGVVTFTIALVWPSSDTCVSEWNDGSAPQGNYQVSWFVGEKGAYDIGGIQMEITTISADALGWNKGAWSQTFGSDCNYPSQNDDDDYAPGAVFSLQTDNNDGQYLVVRARNWHKTSSTKCNYAWAAGDIRLYPHDFNKTTGSIDTNAIQAETVGVFVFDARAPDSVDCLGGSYIEVGQVTGMTNSPYNLKTSTAMDTSSVPVGVFGSVLTLTGGDAFVMKSYSESSSSSDIFSFIQEDVCTDEELIHYPEVFSYFIATPTTSDDCTNAIVGKHTYPPSQAPSQIPTESAEQKEGSGSSGSGSKDVLLAVFLPICIIILVAGVGYVTKKVFLSKPLEESSEHSGLNLVP